MKQKGLAPILIVLLIAVVIGGYVIYQNQSKPAVISQPSPNPSVNSTKTIKWKTYINKEYKFSVDYPDYLQVKENSFSTYKSTIFSSEYKSPFSSYFNFGIIVHTVKNNALLKNWLNDYVIQNLPTGTKRSIVSGKTISYKNNNIEGLYFIGGKESENKYIFYQKGNYIYEVILSGSGTGASYKENPNGEKLLDQILSTFQFTN